MSIMIDNEYFLELKRISEQLIIDGFGYLTLVKQLDELVKNIEIKELRDNKINEILNDR